MIFTFDNEEEFAEFIIKLDGTLRELDEARSTLESFFQEYREAIAHATGLEAELRRRDQAIQKTNDQVAAIIKGELI